jgi:hypothetical protein
MSDTRYLFFMLKPVLRIRDVLSRIRISKCFIPDPDPESRIQWVKKHRKPYSETRIRIRKTG